MNTTLIIMAAGIGSRYGKGIKQLAKIGPHDEIIMDYSIYDALEAGFNKSFLLLEKTSKKNLKKLLVIVLKNTFKLNMFSKKLIIFLKGVQYPKVESNLGELDKLFYLVKESLMNHLSLSMLMIIMEKLLLKSSMIF